MTSVLPAGLELPGLDPAWSRTVTAADAEGIPRTWHVLDNGVQATVATFLCAHGNPTWSYLWRGLLAAAPPGWRVVAPDHLGLGFSERTGAPRTLAQRVDDLGRLTDALGLTGPVVTVGHDWGGAISLGWALAHPDQLRGIVLGNTAVAQPPGDAGPALIRLAHVPWIREYACVRTPGFVRATTALSRPALPDDVRRAFAAPYRSASRRHAVGDFVADIPFAVGHPSRPTIEAIAEGVRTLQVPALLLWGPRAPVFGEKYLADLRARVPHARLHRYEGASHLVTEDAPQYTEAIASWAAAELAGKRPASPRHPPARATPTSPPPPADTTGHRLWSELEQRATHSSPAVVEVGHTPVSWAALAARVRDLASGMAVAGIRPGQRIGMLIEPSADLTAVVYAAWRAGAVVVVADKGLGFEGMRRALRSASLDHVVGATAGLVAGRLMGVPGGRLAVGDPPLAVRRGLGVSHTLDELAALGREALAGGRRLPAEPPLDSDCAVVFTSGATGPAKGVVYRHTQVASQLALLRSTYRLTEDDRLVAAFAPFSLLGPALG
ncbi:MAG: cis-3-alkyl-4-acyloxetan-2-one decarboxylase / olefin beta-lactone synthetase, partial [Gaiellales bacterium]|nr:cis-3-alkyl-4-acyloxetan-2-one decarboxylase / olefin beta-lactone synthetase [Gaiellales bacterium]